MTISIDRIENAQLDQLVPLFDGYRQFYRQRSDMPAAKNYLSERLSMQQCVIFLAKYNDEPAGFTLLYPIFSSVRVRKIWILNDLFVTQTARGRGIAQALLNHATQFAKASGAARILLETGNDNHAAQALYRKAGWRTEDSQWFSVDF